MSLTRAADLLLSNPARRLVLAVVILAAILGIGVACVSKQLRTGSDFPIYYAAARTLLSGGSPYDVTTGLHGYVYLPFFALLLAPLSALPLAAAASVWYLANVFFAVASIRAAVRIAGEGVVGVPPWWALAALAPLLGFFHDNLVLGQANLFLLGLVVWGSAGVLGSEGRARHGFLLGVAAGLKMNAALLILPILIRGRIRPTVGFAAGLSLSILLPLLLLGPQRGVDLTRQWRAKVVLPAAEGTLQGSRTWDQSPAAAMRRLLVDAPAFGETRVNLTSISQAEFTRWSRIVGAGIFLTMLAVWLFCDGKGRRETLLLDLSIASCGVLQVLGFNLKAHFVLLTLPALVAVSRAWRPVPGGKAVRATLATAGILLLVSNPGLAGRAVSNVALAYSAVTMATLLVAGTLVWLRCVAGARDRVEVASGGDVD